ncbi:tetratricopeptide repeat protein [Bacillus sp. JCM 19034]|uniref:InlB B-repeat-containing protein n=1 Tax=Bacillus sp. JCM 19034 TaxID=1481928 RepID=UPI0007853FCE|nr:tetratricopeptide repeat protein [Bacillus sp. JCM 19034]
MSKKVLISMISFVLIISVAGLLLFPFESSGKIEELEREANYSFDQAHYDESIELYKEILAIDPLHINARVGLAHSYIGIARLDLAEQTLREGIDLQSEVSIFYTHLVDLFLSQSKINDAIAILELGIEQADQTEFQDTYDQFMADIYIHIERPFIQLDHRRPIQLVWSDGEERMIPLDAEWTSQNEEIAKVVEDDLGLEVKGSSIGTTTIVATTGSIERELEIEIKEQVVEDIKWDNIDDEPTVAVNDELELSISAYDANDNPMEVEPDWSLEKGFGTIEESEINNELIQFIADEEGIETIHTTIDGLTSSINIRISGENHTILSDTIGEGHVTIFPEQDTYEPGTLITVEALPAQGWSFVRWEGDLDGTSTSHDLTVEDNLSITAVFARDTDEYQLALSKSGSGTVTQDKSGSTFSPNETVTIHATPDSGWEFVHWTGSLESTNASLTIDMNEDLSLRAVFRQIDQGRTDHINTNDSNTTNNSSSSNNTSSQSNNVPNNKNEKPVNSPPPTDDEEPANDANNEQYNSEKVNEQATPETVQLSVGRRGEGIVLSNRSQHGIEKGSTVTLEARASSNWEFSHWEGDASGTNQVLTVTMNQAKSITAVFIEKGVTEEPEPPENEEG